MYRVLKIEKLANKFFSLTGAEQLMKIADGGSLYPWEDVYNAVQQQIPLLKEDEEESETDPEGVVDAQKELRLIVEAYKEANKIDRGYRYVYDMLKKFLSKNFQFMPEDVEEVIDGFNRDIKARARQQDPDWLKKPIRETNDMGITSFAPDVEAIRYFVENFDDKKPEGTQETIWDAGVGGGDENEPVPGGLEQVDFTDPSKVSNKSIFETGTDDKASPLTEGHDHTNYKTRYEDIIKSEKEMLNNESDPKKQALRKELISEYQKLIALSETLGEHFHEWQTTFGVHKEAAEKQIDKTREQMGEVRNQIRIKKYSLKRMNLKDYIKDLKDKLPTIKNPEERFVLEQEIAIAEANTSGDRHVGKANSVRRNMAKRVKGITEKDKKSGKKVLIDKVNLNDPTEMSKFQNELAEAQKLIIPYEEVRKQEIKTKYEKQQGRMTEEKQVDFGWTPEDEKKLEKSKVTQRYHRRHIDIDSMQLNNIANLLSTALASTKSGEKLVVTRSLKEHSPELLKPFTALIKEVSNASQSRDRTLYNEKLKQLNEAIRSNIGSVVKTLPAFVRYETHLQAQSSYLTVLTETRQLISQLFNEETISVPQGGNKPPKKELKYTWKDQNITTEAQALIDDIITKSKDLISKHGKSLVPRPTKKDPDKVIEIDPKYSPRDPESMGYKTLRGPEGTGPTEYYTHMGSAAQILRILVEHLEKIKENNAVVSNASIKARIKLLHKLAQPIETTVPEEPVIEEQPIPTPEELAPEQSDAEINSDITGDPQTDIMAILNENIDEFAKQLP